MSGKNIIAQPFGRYNFILAGVFCAVFFWLYESYKHAAEFPQLSFVTELISPDVHELWMRLLTVFLFLFSGISSHILLNKARKAKQEAQFAHSELDQIIIMNMFLRTLISQMMSGYRLVSIILPI